MSRKPRIAIVVGHSPKKGGATAFDGTMEHAFNADFAKRLAEALPDEVNVLVFIRNEEDYRTAMRDLVAMVNGYGADLVLSLHSNAMPEEKKGKASGTMGLFWPGSRHGKAFALAIAKAASKAIGIKNRGAIPQARSWAASRLVKGKPVPNGPFLYILQHTRAPAVILESHFLDTKSDHTKAIEARDSGKLPKNIANAIMEVIARNAK